MKKTIEDLSPSEIKKYQFRRVRPNGDIYVYEQETYYDSDAGFNRTLRSRLIGKIVKGTTEMVPTRAKRKSPPKPKPVDPPQNKEEQPQIDPESTQGFSFFADLFNLPME